jgi:MFS family permease
VTGAPLVMPGRWRMAALSCFRFGINFHWQPINNVVLQVQVVTLLGRESQGRGIGTLFAVGTVFATLVPPLVGAVSDRVWTRFGRRRPLIVAATGLDLVGLAIMLTAGAYAQLLVGYLVTQLANNGAAAAYNGLVPDTVPASRFGSVSGLLATLSQVGQACGLLATIALAGAGRVTLMYAVIGLVLVITMIPTVLAGRERRPAPAGGAGAEPGGAGSSPGDRPAAAGGPGRREAPPLLAFWMAQAVDVVRRVVVGDFGWVFLTRLFVTCGVNAVSPFLLPFFRDVVGVAKPAQFTPIWLVSVIALAIPCALVGGALSDRLGRKRFVYAAGVLQALVALFFLAFYPTEVGVVLAMAAAYGVGYGLFVSVDSALALDTLPDRERAARDLGLMHVAEVLPGVLIPAVGGFALDAFNHHSPGSGYRFVFGAAAVFFLLGGVLVRQVRSVR